MMLKFAENIKAYVPNVILTVVDVIGEEENKRIEEAMKEADDD